MYGVGDWTASLMLMNSFERSNIFPNKDATLRSAVQKLYGFDILEETERFENISDIWSPHKSLVARMLWFASDNKLI